MKRILLALVLVLLGMSTSFATQYTLVDLGALPGDISSRAVAINNHSQVIGVSTRLFTDPKGNPYAEGYPFIWEGGTMTQLTALGTTAMGALLTINEAGDILTQHALLSADGSVQTLDSGSYADDMNDRGQVILSAHGTSYILESDGTHTPLDDNGGRVQANAINNNGQVVGDSFPPGYTHNCAVLCKDGAVTRILDQEYAVAVDINDLGQLIGYHSVNIGTTGGNYVWAAFSWRNGAYTELGPWAGSMPYAINNLGQIVGTANRTGGTGYACLWQDGSVRDLNSLVTNGAGWSLREAGDINDLGQIVGTGKFGGVDHAYLLNPVPEPCSMLALLTGLCGVGLRMRRR